MRTTILWVAMGLLVARGVAQGQGYAFLKVVDDRTARPDGGTFWPVNPSLEGNTVVFNQGALCAGCPAPDSIWAADLETGGFTKLVDRSQAVPGSVARWDFFDARPVLRGGRVVFIAYDTAGKPGLYAVGAAGGAVARLVDTTMMVPGANTPFTTFDRGGFHHDGTTVVFSGGGSGISGVYSVKIDGTGLARVADGNTPVNSNQCDVFPAYQFTAPSISSGGMLVRGQTVFDSSNGYNALYLGPLTKMVGPGCTPYPSVINSLQKLPGDPASSSQTRFSYGLIDGQTVFFRADDPNSGVGGIYSAAAAPKATGNAATRIVDTTTVLPVLGACPFVNSYTFAASQQNVVFHALEAAGKRNGLFVWSGGAIAKLAVADDSIDGFRVTGVDAPATTAMDGGSVAFVWNRSDFQRQLTVARPAAGGISIDGVANAASYASGTIAPGEVVAVFGKGLGPASLQTAVLDANGRVSTALAGVRVLFDGLPAPLVYVGALNGGLATVIVPYGIDGRDSVTVSAEYQGQVSAPLSMKVVAAVPGIYTSDASGKGQAVVLNQDLSYNSAANPAARGSVITLFASGMGQTNPPGVDGQISGVSGPSPVARVTVTIGGVAAAPGDILYQAMAPLVVTGLFQMNFKIPQGVPSGSQPIVLTAGSASSSPDVTVAVQ